MAPLRKSPTLVMEKAAWGGNPPVERDEGCRKIFRDFLCPLLTSVLVSLNICAMVHITFPEVVAVHRALADPMRIAIMRLLLMREYCVCELEAVLQEPQYKVSRHLTVLKQAGLVREWREGTWIHHEIAPSLSPAWSKALLQLREAWDATPTILEILTRVAQQVTRPAGGTCGMSPCASTTKQRPRKGACCTRNVEQICSQPPQSLKERT